MKKIMLVAAMLAMMLLSAAPAFAGDNDGFEIDASVSGFNADASTFCIGGWIDCGAFVVQVDNSFDVFQGFVGDTFVHHNSCWDELSGFWLVLCD